MHRLCRELEEGQNGVACLEVEPVAVAGEFVGRDLGAFVGGFLPAKKGELGIGPAPSRTTRRLIAMTSTSSKLPTKR